MKTAKAVTQRMPPKKRKICAQCKNGRHPNCSSIYCACRVCTIGRPLDHSVTP